MSLVNKNINEFLSLLDSSNPTPGGGSASALISAIGLSLSRMVSHLTINKKSFSELPTDVQDEFNTALETIADIKNTLIPLIDKDAESFNKVMAAYKLPKNNEIAQETRQKAIKTATLGAIHVPFEIAKLSLDALKCVDVILKYGNTSAITDVGVSVLALSAGIEGALLNVLINLGGLGDDKLVTHYKTEVEHLKKEMNLLKDTYLKTIYRKLG